VLRLTSKDGHLEYVNGFDADPQTVTRYGGERWEQVSSDLLCGVADTFQDAAIIFTGRSTSQLQNGVDQASRGKAVEREDTLGGWRPLNASNRHKSIYSVSEQQEWLFVPNSREAVEAVISWIFWEENFRATAFTGYRDFRSRLLSATWNVASGDLEKLIEACVDGALFQMAWGPGTWHLFPGSIHLSSLIRLADPVVARINTELTD
jgi:hypothetical protein